MPSPPPSPPSPEAAGANNSADSGGLHDFANDEDNAGSASVPTHKSEMLNTGDTDFAGTWRTTNDFCCTGMPHAAAALISPVLPFRQHWLDMDAY